MKKLISVILSTTMILSLVACGKNEKPSEIVEPSDVVKASDKVYAPLPSKVPEPSFTQSIGKGEKPSKANNFESNEPSITPSTTPSNIEKPTPSNKYENGTYLIEEVKPGIYNFNIKGNTRTLEFNHTYNEETYDYSLHFGYTNGDVVSKYTDTDYGYFNSAYIIKAPDESFAYLYVIIGLDNDWTRLLAYNITNGVEKINDYWNLDIPYDLRNADTIDINNFKLVSRINALGTYMSYRYYTINQDASLTPVHIGYIPYTAEMGIPAGVSIHCNQDVELYKKNTDGTISNVPTIYPANFEFQVVETDEETYVDLYVVATGETARIYVQKGESGLFEINGVLDYDIFPDVPYAG